MAKLDGEIKYDGSLMNFNLSGPIIFSDPEDDWFFVIYLPYESNFVNKICQFKFVFGGWQDNIESYEESGFSDIEEITSHLASWGLRINEVYYDVAPDKGNEGHTANPDEWIELYNPTNQDINVKDWTITDNTCSRTINANINIPAGGFAVVSKDASTWAPGTGYWILPAGTTKIILGQNIGNGLANDGDRVILSRFDGLEIDAVSYGTDTYAFVPACSDVDEGHSLARHPKGFDTNQASDWEDLTNPNPGTNPHYDLDLDNESEIVNQEEITEPAISQVEGLTEESILNQENSSPQVEIENENITGDGDMTEEEDMINSEPEGLEEQNVFDEEREGSFDESEEVKTDDGKDIEQLQEATEEAVEEVIEENFEISQEDEELDNSEEMDIDERDINEEDSISDENVFEEENTAGDGEEIEENAKDENAVDEIVEEDTEEIDAEIDSASEQEEIDEASEDDTEEDVTDDEESEIAAEKDGGEIEEDFISDQSINDVSLDKNLTEGSEEVADEDSSSNSSDTQEVEEQTGSLPNSVSISGASDESDERNDSDGDNSDSGGIDGENES